MLMEIVLAPVLDRLRTLNELDPETLDMLVP
jgi:hypothetical protein